MSIPAGHIITVGALNVIDRLQDAGLQNPRIPTEVVRETGNDLVVGKILTEADFSFQLTSWDVSCDMMAMLEGKSAEGFEPNEGPSAGDAPGTEYKWEDCQFINLACPYAKDTGTQGGHITSGVLIPAYYPTALSYKFGVTANAEQTVTLNGGSYYMAGPGAAEHEHPYPIEEVFNQEQFGNLTVKGTTIETAEAARVHRIGGFGSTTFRHVYGVLRNGVIQQEGVDFVEEGGAAPGAEPKKVKVKFAKEFLAGETIKLVYFSEVAHEIPQAVHADTTITPAAVRGRNIEVFLGPIPAGAPHEGDTIQFRGVQTLDLNATHTGQVQREMGTYDPIGYNETGIDTNGTITLDPKEIDALYTVLEATSGISRDEVIGYLNEHAVPLKIKIFNPRSPSEVIKSIHIGDALVQAPGTTAKANQVLALPMTFESEKGTFTEVKGE